MPSVFDSLPDEVIEFILSVKSLGCKDVCCLGQCCKRFHGLVKSENLWKLKANERWKIWDEKLQFSDNCSWQRVYRNRHQVEVYIKKQFSVLQEESVRFQTVMSKQDFGFLNTCLNMYEENSYYYVKDTIQSILRGTESSRNLTEKYFAKKAFISLTCLICKNDLHSFLENPEQAILHLEEGATIIARWMCPWSEISLQDIDNKLENIANMVRPKLGLEKDQKIPSKSDTSVQLNAINMLKDVFYNHLKFRGNQENYYHLSNSYINEVIETKLGIPISLSVIFLSIANRIGISIEPVNCPGHFLVRWKYLDSSTNEVAYRHIDCFNQGGFLDLRTLHHFSTPGPVPPPREIIKRMILNIIHILQTEVQTTETTHLQESFQNLSHALDLFMILAPDHVEMTRLNARVKLYLDVQLEEVINSFRSLLSKQSTVDGEDERLLEQLVNRRKVLLSKKQKVSNVKLRSEPSNVKVSFKVGSIMHHHRFDYKCVVYGWDPFCKMSEEWINQMGVDTDLSHGRNQPFYNVLVCDGSERYASQESLGDEPQIEVITHPEVGRYFKEFTGDQYIPNEQLQKLYPEDLPSM